MTEPVSERTRQRRRILRAAAGVPIVLTLPSGAALAATSGVCDLNSLKTLEDYPTTTYRLGNESTGPDSWMRIELQKYLIAGRNAGGNTPRVPGFTHGNTWYTVSMDLQSAVPIVPQNTDPNNPNGPDIVHNEFYYALVSLEEGLVVLLFDQDDMDINPIAGASCWNSLMSTNLTRNVIN